MKKRVISLFCAALCMLAAFAFAGCTDKPRKLDDVEKSIVGEWRDADGWGFNFNADGTYTTTNGNSGTFKHDGYGLEPMSERGGRYEIIVNNHSGSKYALFDEYPDLLCYVQTDGIIQPNDSLQTLRRVVNEDKRYS